MRGLPACVDAPKELKHRGERVTIKDSSGRPHRLGTQIVALAAAELIEVARETKSESARRYAETLIDKARRPDVACGRGRRVYNLKRTETESCWKRAQHLVVASARCQTIARA
jgi:ribosomal protein L17